jgi:hypothetical protein
VSRDDIMAALEAITAGRWLIEEDEYVDGYSIVLDDDGPGTAYIAQEIVQGPDHGAADAHLIANSPRWLTELLAENERLTVDSERAREQYGYAVDRAQQHEAEVDRLREEARAFSEALGYGDGRTEPAASLADLIDPLTEALADGREHIECPVHCGLCGERLAATTCALCRGGGCLPNPEQAYVECDECAGVGKVHLGCAEMTYAQLAARAEAAEQTIQRVRDLALGWLRLAGQALDPDAREWSAAAGRSVLRALDGGGGACNCLHGQRTLGFGAESDMGSILAAGCPIHGGEQS